MLFVATNNEETENNIRRADPNMLIAQVNDRVASQARKYVYGIDDSEQDFVDKLISSDRPQTLLEKLRDRRRQKYAPS